MSTDSEKLKEKLSLLPEKPGIYIFRDSGNRIIYIGKSRNLRERVKAYFTDDADTRYQISFLRNRIHDFEFIVTGTEKEALILENEFIKKYKPRFNIKLRDDKSFVNIRVSEGDEFPRIHVVRKPDRENSIIFGPYSSAKSARKTLKLLLRAFPLRSCSDDEFKKRKRPCILYDIGECSAPCVGYISKEDYNLLVKSAISFLRGKRREIMDGLRTKMEKLASEEKFEEAAKVRDKIFALEKTLESQRIVTDDEIDRDVFAIAGEGQSFCVSVLNIRHGVLQNVLNIFINKSQEEADAVMESILSQYYDSGNYIPDEIILDRELGNEKIYEERFEELSGNRVRILTPRKGVRREILNLAETNARDFLRYKLSSPEGVEETLKEIKDVLHLRRLPRIIEAVDISNISGRMAVGAKVAFVCGKPEKSLYRLYKIKTVNEVDDYGMMYEVLKRRIERGKEENDLPDLLLIDGGKGHLNVALTVCKDSGVDNVDVVSIAKGEENLLDKRMSVDHFYIPGIMNPVFFRNNSSALLFLQRIRDEAHRFAIKYHRKLMSKGLKQSILDSIEGIGEKRKRALLLAFGSVERMRQATVEELVKVNGMTENIARRVYEVLHK